MNLRSLVFALSFSGCLWMWYSVVAQESSKPADEVKSEASPKELRDGQLAISGRFARFERMLSQMADILGRQDPERADLLRRAIGKGREDQVKEDIERIVVMLEKGELGTATEKQLEVVGSLETLLKLLQSEDRRSSVEREQERLNGLLKDVRNVIVEQKSARAATQNSQAPSNAAPGQQKALSETDSLLESMKEHDDQIAKDEQRKNEDSEKEGGSSKDGKAGVQQDGNSKDAESKDNKSKNSDPKDGKTEDGKSEDGKSEKGDPKDGQPGDPTESESKPQEQAPGQQKSGQQKSGNKEAKQTPGREQLEKARQQMEQALEELKKQQRENALKNEDQAIQELHEAAARLEQMLKQLREEEKEMMLASLEARFQRMLTAETEIHEGTVSLAATPQKDWLDQYYGRCRELAQLQSDLATECSQTVNLLREDGTSVAILLAVEDIEADMNSVTGWLQESKVSELTQSVQTDIIESLKQLIETAQKEMQEMKDQQKQEQQNQSEQKEGLVQLMAEIRMLRNLQLQVNRRTKQVDGLLQKAPTDDLPSLMKQVHDLAVRQQRLIESAKELAKQAK